MLLAQTTDMQTREWAAMHESMLHRDSMWNECVRLKFGGVGGAVDDADVRRCAGAKGALVAHMLNQQWQLPHTLGVALRPGHPLWACSLYRGSAKCLPTHRSCLPPRQAGR
jgi:hypothetical protein